MIINSDFQNLHDVNDYSDYVFSLFDPLSCEINDLKIPDPYPQKVLNVIKRSRLLLKKRNMDEICFAVNALHDMNSMMMHGLSIDQNASEYAHDYIVPFFDYMSMFDISQLDEFPDATWSEFFAISALICAGIILETFDRDDKTYEQAMGIEDAVDWPYFAFETTLYAVEAIAYAESLEYNDSKIDKQVKEKISIKNRNAVKIRHASKNAIKDEFVDYYNKNTKFSKAEAARRFYNNLPGEKLKHFRDETCAIRSMLDHQRKLSNK